MNRTKKECLQRHYVGWRHKNQKKGNSQHSSESSDADEAAAAAATTTTFTSYSGRNVPFWELFFGYNRCDSVTWMLLDTGLPSFNTVVHNCQFTFTKSWLACRNCIVELAGVCVCLCTSVSDLCVSLCFVCLLLFADMRPRCRPDGRTDGLLSLVKCDE